MDYKSLVERVLTPTGVSGNENIYLCPKCNDKSGHLYVNYLSGKYNCVRCGQFKGKSISSLLERLNIDYKYDYEFMESEGSKDLDLLLKERISFTNEKDEVPYSTNLDSLTSFLLYHIKPLSMSARNYLYSRGLNDYYIDLFKIYEGVNNYGIEFNINGTIYKGRNYSNRIMIPSLHKNNLVSFYIARDYTNQLTPKYLNPPKELAYSSEDVWNLDLIESEHVVICEGVLTAISVNIALNKNIAVATYGKSISDKSNNTSSNLIVSSQGEKLINRKFKTYIVFYDKDATESALNTCSYLYERGANVRLVHIDTDKYGPKADANNMTREEIIYYINNSVVYNRFTGLI